MEHQVIKEADLFLVSNQWGDVEANQHGLGLYIHDTRFLSRLTLTIDGVKPVLLSSTLKEGCLLEVRLTNPDLRDEKGTLPQGALEIRRSLLVNGRSLFQLVSVTSYSSRPVPLTLELSLDADFCDIFTVRGLVCPQRGTILPPRREAAKIVLSYAGRDQVLRQTEVSFSSPPSAWRKETALFTTVLQPRRSWQLLTVITPRQGETEQVEPAPAKLKNSTSSSYAFSHYLKNVLSKRKAWQEACTAIETGNAAFNELIAHSQTDLRSLLTDLGEGPLAVAGVPWFAVPFGRDALISAWEVLSLNPEIARGTLLTLARYQGQKVDPTRDEEPGKIMHELRSGELANLRSIPFTPYYGSVDATPLFVVLLGEYFRWTGDLELVRRLFPAAHRAMEWIDQYGDVDGDGYVEYQCRSERGLANQGWKDSGDAIVNRNGELARPPIALVEVQSYVYGARLHFARLAQVLGEKELAGRMISAAAALREKFNRDFWLPEQGFFALALDGDKRPVEAITSNPGHCLLFGLVEDELVRPMIKKLLSSSLFSGWGIRTMSSQEVAYNPLSYHNGSVWPHDNALIGLGMQRYGFPAAVQRVALGLLEASCAFPHHRLPELFCGYSRTESRTPVEYPVACAPQAWAAGAPFLLLQALLGLHPDAPAQRLIVSPALPPWLGYVRLQGLRIGSARVDLYFARRGRRTAVELLKVEGGPLRLEVHPASARLSLVAA